MVSKLVKALISLRYDVTVTGLETITQRKGVLVIPNHPAEIDPVILSTFLWDLLKPQPVVLETMYELPLLKPLMKWVRATPMPDMEFDSGPYKRRRIERALEDVSERLRRGENILIYPSGRLSVTGEERLGAASGVQTILRNYPDVFVAVVRIKGLYGSIFSKALTGGHTPDVGTTLKEGLSILVKNLLFLAPKRKVTIEIVTNPSDLPRYSDALKLNRYLESYYNSPAPETPTLVPHLVWSNEVPRLPERAEENHSYDEITEATKEKVFKHIAHVGATDINALTTETELGDDLGLDSLTVAELLLWLDREFEAHDIELSELVTVGSVLRAAAGQLGSKTPKREYRVPGVWFSSVEKRPIPRLQSAPTLGEAFLLAANVMEDLPAIGDARSGVLSWAEIKLRVIIMARHLAKLPDTHIGLLFPASVGGDPAVVLFTSGSEALPKGVVLTHENILSNIRGILDAFPLKQEDVLLGFLPTFHSFGLTVCTLLPLLTGLRVAYHPNPNESRKIAKIVSHWGASIIAGTPTFLRSILQAGQPDQFATLRTLISGAERAPEDLFEKVRNIPHPVEVVEGYGITECAPVVSMNRPGEPRVGVGRPLTGTTIKIVNPVSLEGLPPGTDGLILIHSPSVFPGYLETKLNPFVQVEGVRYYNSGDIGRLENGSLVISGRLKRFIKIAGEMVSLTAVEEALQKHTPSYDDVPSIAVLARGAEGDGRPTLTLFTSTQTTVESANKILRDSGFPHLVAIAQVIKLKDLPLLGSGKTDYQALKEML
ncbi:hypothetical protein EB061_06215 [bacterium]|nr:hypothetical protein [bacterium]